MVQRGDVIQVTNPDHPWYPSLMIVDEDFDNGCRAKLPYPRNAQSQIHVLYIRMQSPDYRKVGHTVIKDI